MNNSIRKIAFVCNLLALGTTLSFVNKIHAFSILPTIILPKRINNPPHDDLSSTSQSRLFVSSTARSYGTNSNGDGGSNVSNRKSKKQQQPKASSFNHGQNRSRSPRIQSRKKGTNAGGGKHKSPSRNHQPTTKTSIIPPTKPLKPTKRITLEQLGEMSIGQAIQESQSTSHLLHVASTLIWLPTDLDLKPHFKTQAIHAEKRRRSARYEYAHVYVCLMIYAFSGLNVCLFNVCGSYIF